MLQLDTMAFRSAKPSGPGKQTKSEAVYQALHQQILTSIIPAGSIVSERMLAERLGVGKAPVRVAIQRLSAEGFLTIEPRRGIRIVQNSVQNILDLFQVRMLMEKLVVRQLAGNLSENQVARLRENLDELSVAAEFTDAEEMIAVDFAFHRMLTEFHGNRQMAVILDRTLDALYREICASMKEQNRAEERLGEHQRIVESLIDGDPEAAERAIVDHLRCGQRFVMSRGETSVLSEG